MNYVRATVKWPTGAARGELLLDVRHFWDALTALMASDLVPDEPFVIEVKAENREAAK